MQQQVIGSAEETEMKTSLIVSPRDSTCLWWSHWQQTVWPRDSPLSNQGTSSHHTIDPPYTCAAMHHVILFCLFACVFFKNGTTRSVMSQSISQTLKSLTYQWPCAITQLAVHGIRGHQSCLWWARVVTPRPRDGNSLTTSVGHLTIYVTAGIHWLVVSVTWHPALSQPAAHPGTVRKVDQGPRLGQLAFDHSPGAEWTQMQI